MLIGFTLWALLRKLKNGADNRLLFSSIYLHYLDRRITNLDFALYLRSVVSPMREAGTANPCLRDTANTILFLMTCRI